MANDTQVRFDTLKTAVRACKKTVRACKKLSERVSSASTILVLVEDTRSADNLKAYQEVAEGGASRPTNRVNRLRYRLTLDRLSRCFLPEYTRERVLGSQYTFRKNDFGILIIGLVFSESASI